MILAWYIKKQLEFFGSLPMTNLRPEQWLVLRHLPQRHVQRLDGVRRVDGPPDLQRVAELPRDPRPYRGWLT